MRYYYFGGQMYLDTVNAPGTNQTFVTTTNGDTTGVMYHVVATYNASNRNVTLYLDNVRIGSVVSTANNFGGSNLWIGANNDSANFGHAVIDEIYVYNYTLTPTQVSELWNSGAGLQPYPDVVNNTISISTLTATNITLNSAFLRGNITNASNFTDMYGFFSYKLANESVYINTTSQLFTTNTTFNATITGLLANTTYDYRAVVRYDGNTTYALGDVVQFTTLEPFTIRAQNIYNSSQILVFNATVNNTFYTTTNGLITLNTSLSSGTIYNITIESNTYIPLNLTNYNSSFALNAQMYQAVAQFQATKIINNQTLTNSTFLLGNDFIRSTNSTTATKNGNTYTVAQTLNPNTYIEYVRYNTTTANGATTIDTYLVFTYADASTATTSVTNSPNTLTISQVNNPQLNKNVTKIEVFYRRQGTSANVNVFTTQAYGYDRIVQSGQDVLLNGGNIDVTFVKTGWYPLKKTINIESLTNQTYNITGVYDVLVKFNATTLLNGSAILNFTASPTNQSPSNTTNGTLFIPALQNLTYFINFESFGFFPKTESYNWNSSTANETIVLQEAGAVSVEFRDSVTNLTLLVPVTLRVESADLQEIYTITGSGPIQDLQVGVTYNMFFNTSTYASNEFTFVYNSQSLITLYMAQNTFPILYTVVSESNQPLNQVIVKVEKFVNGTYTQISSALTDFTGLATFNLERGQTHRITFTKSGYVQVVDITQVPLDAYTIVMGQDTTISLDLGTGNVALYLLPNAFVLPTGAQNFTLDITRSEVDISSFFLTARSATNSIIQTQSSSNPQGGQLQLSFDTTSFNGTNIVIHYGYVLSDGTAHNFSRTYQITDQIVYTGSILELKDRLSSMLSPIQAIVLYTVLFFVVVLASAIVLNGTGAILVALLFSIFTGWLFGINLLIIGVITMVVFIYVIAQRDEVI